MSYVIHSDMLMFHGHQFPLFVITFSRRYCDPSYLFVGWFVRSLVASGHRLQWQASGGRRCVRLSEMAPYERFYWFSIAPYTYVYTQAYLALCFLFPPVMTSRVTRTSQQYLFPFHIPLEGIGEGDEMA